MSPKISEENMKKNWKLRKTKQRNRKGLKYKKLYKRLVKKVKPEM